METACFVHSYTRGGDVSILIEIVASVVRSGLLERLDRLDVVNVGEEIAMSGSLPGEPERVRLINYSPRANRSELPTLGLVGSFATAHPEARVLYLHTWGASHDARHAVIDDWRRMLLYFLVERFDSCLEMLGSHDAVGCNLLASPRPHFSGNFWWARAPYLASLESPTGDRHEAEFWLLGGAGVRAVCVHDSGVNHSRERWPRERCAGSAASNGRESR